MAKSRSFLKWAGGKYACINTIISNLPPGKRLVEPFTGSGVVFLNSHYDQYLLGEANLDLVQLFTHLKEYGSDFIKLCQHLFTPENNTETNYYQIRSQFNEAANSVQKSAWFLYLNRHGYNGLCRYNSSGGYNVPFGRYKKPYFPEAEMLHFQHKSSKAIFSHSDFRRTFEQAQQGDVIYCDPPYVPLADTIKFNYIKDPFTNEDQIELAELAIKAASRGITVLISNHDTPFTRKHYKQADILSFGVKRVINCQGNLRIPAREILAVFS